MDSTGKKKQINILNFSLKYGLAAGLAMSTTLLIFQLFNYEYAPFLKLVKYLFLIGFTALMLNSMRNVFTERFFAKGIIAGLRSAFTAGLTIAFCNLLIYFIAPELSFTKYTLVPNAVFEAVTVSAILLIETFVFGGIITFFFLQMFKNNTQQLSEVKEQ